MDILFYVVVILNLLLTTALCCKIFKKPERLQKCKQKPNKTQVAEQSPEVSANEIPDPEMAYPKTQKNEELHKLAQECEEKLKPEERGLIKILIKYDDPTLPAMLKVGSLIISIIRDGVNKSLHDASSVLDAIAMARYGHDDGGTARYVPVPKELHFILEHYEAINVYLQALNLELIDPNDTFLCVNASTGYYTGWKRFGWSVERANECLEKHFRLKHPDGFGVCPKMFSAKLFLLLKGWEHLFVEV